jgi:hypothetical protein
MPQKVTDIKNLHQNIKITSVNPNNYDNFKPKIGITCICCDGKYSLKNFIKSCKEFKKCERDLLNELQNFIDEFRSENTISDAIKNHISPKSGKNDDKDSVKQAEYIRKQLKRECDSLLHIHTKRGGKHKFSIHGFQDKDVFEIVWLDPEHEKFKV